MGLIRSCRVECVRRRRGAGQDHSSEAGIIEANEQLIFTSLPRYGHPASGHPLRDLPTDRGLPARHPHRGADRALPPGPSRSSRASRPVTPATRRINPLVPSPAATAADAERPRARSVAVFDEGPHNKYPPFRTGTVLSIQPVGGAQNCGFCAPSGNRCGRNSEADNS